MHVVQHLWCYWNSLKTLLMDLMASCCHVHNCSDLSCQYKFFKFREHCDPAATIKKIKKNVYFVCFHLFLKVEWKAHPGWWFYFLFFYWDQTKLETEKHIRHERWQSVISRWPPLFPILMSKGSVGHVQRRLETLVRAKGHIFLLYVLVFGTFRGAQMGSCRVWQSSLT